MTTSSNVLYTARTHTVGGRDKGFARSSDGNLDVTLSPPGSGRPGTNPEQLFAAGWSACFEGAIGLACRLKKLPPPHELAVDAEVDLCRDDSGFFLRARLYVSLPGLDHDLAQSLVDLAHQTCPYSKAIRGNVDVAITLL
jgi:Ohr subfamily peroxiredoxin